MSITDGLALLLAAYLGASGIGKIVDTRGFAAILRGTYGLASGPAAILAVVVPATEVAAAVLIGLPSTRSVGLLAGVFWLVAVAMVATFSWARGAQGDCGCLGVFRHDQLSVWTLGRAAALAATASVLLLVRLGA